MKQAYVLGLDYGTDSARALLIDAHSGKEIDSEVSAYTRWSKGLYCNPSINQFRQHPLDYLESLKQVVCAITSRNRELVPSIVAIAIDSTGSTPCLIDQQGKPLALHEEYASCPEAMFVLWKDHTGQKEADLINEACSRAEVNYSSHSGYTYSAECFWAKVLHQLRVCAPLRKDAWSAVELCDWIPATLTGCHDASEIRMGHCACGAKWMWADEWGGFPPASFFKEIDPLLLPILEHLPKQNYGCDKSVGVLCTEWAEILGLRPGIPIGVGNIDSHSGAVGAGVQEGTAVLNLGTSACYMTVISKDKIGNRVIPGVFGQVDGSILPDMVGFESGLSAFGDIYAWFKRLLCWPLHNIVSQIEQIDSSTRELVITQTEEQIMNVLNAEAEKIVPTLETSSAVDWFNGRRSPFTNDTLSGMLSGLKLSTTAPEVYYALVEATAFATRRILDHFAENGIEIDRLIGVGGIAQKSSFVMQLLSDVTQRRIDVSECKQACAMGSAIHAATAAGIYRTVTEAQQAMCQPVTRSYTPNSNRFAILNQRYQNYLRAGSFIENNKQQR